MRENDDISYAASKVIAQAIEGDDLIRAGEVLDRLEDAGFIVLPVLQPGKVAEIAEAVRNGDWRGLSDWDWRTWVGAVHAGYVTKDTVGMGVEAATVMLEPGKIEELPRGTVAQMASDHDEDEQPEKDNWGVRACLADDMAARHGCRVELSGRDDPENPNTYYDDNATYAVVTDRSTGRLVGLVECWDTEDGDPIVPRTWLKAVLLAWRANATPKRAA